ESRQRGGRLSGRKSLSLPRGFLSLLLLEASHGGVPGPKRDRVSLSGESLRELERGRGDPSATNRSACGWALGRTSPQARGEDTMTSPTRWLGAALHGWWSARSGKVRALWIIVVAAPVFVGLHLLSKGDTERVVIAELGAPEIEDVASSLARRGIAYEERRTAGGAVAPSV